MARGTQAGVPREDHRSEGPSQEAVQAVAHMTSQMEMMKAQMRSLEGEKEQAKVEVETLRRKCQKMGIKIGHLEDDCAKAYEDSSQAKRTRRAKEKEPEVASFEMRKLHEKIRSQDKLIAKILEKKKEVEMNRRVQEQRMEALQQTLSETHLQADRGWASAKKFHDSLVIADKNEERMRQKLEELGLEREQWRLEAQRQEQEKNEWVGGWQYEAEFQEAEKREWMKKYEDMSANVQYQAEQWANYFDEADIELRVDPWLKLPPKINEFLKHCRNLAKGFRKKKMKSLM